MKWLIPIAILIALCCINAHYEIFALNIPKGQGNEKREGSFRVMTWNVNGHLVTEDVAEVRLGILPDVPEELKKIIEELHYKVHSRDVMIDIAEEMFGIQIKKKLGPKR